MAYIAVISLCLRWLKGAPPRTYPSSIRKKNGNSFTWYDGHTRCYFTSISLTEGRSARDFRSSIGQKKIVFASLLFQPCSFAIPVGVSTNTTVILSLIVTIVTMSAAWGEKRDMIRQQYSEKVGRNVFRKKSSSRSVEASNTSIISQKIRAKCCVPTGQWEQKHCFFVATFFHKYQLYRTYFKQVLFMVWNQIVIVHILHHSVLGFVFHRACSPLNTDFGLRFRSQSKKKPHSEVVSHFLRPLATNSRISKLLGWRLEAFAVFCKVNMSTAKKTICRDHSFAAWKRVLRLRAFLPSHVRRPKCKKKTCSKGDTYLQTRIEEIKKFHRSENGSTNDFARDQALILCRNHKGNQVEVKRDDRGHCHCWVIVIVEKSLRKFRNYGHRAFPYVLRIFSRYILIRMAFLGDVKMFQCLCSIPKSTIPFFLVEVCNIRFSDKKQRRLIVLILVVL